MRNIFLYLLAALLLGAGPAAAMNPLSAVVVGGGQTVTFTGAPNKGSGAVTTYNNNYYQRIEIRPGGTGIFNDGENVDVLIVRTGGTLRFGQNGEVSKAISNSTVTNTITLEPGAIVQLANPNGLPFASGSYAANNPNNPNGTSTSFYTTPFTVVGLTTAYYTFNGTVAQTTSAPADAARGGYNRALPSGIALPSTVARLTLSNNAGLTMVNNTGVSQLLTTLNGQVTVASAATLTLLSTSASTAQLDLLSSGAANISGNFAVQRYIDGSLNAGTGYRHLSAPVTGQTVASFTSGSFAPTVNAAYNSNPYVAAADFPTVFSYDETRVGGSVGPVGFDQGWLSPSALTDGLTLGRGYTVNMPPTAATGGTITFTGAPTTASITLSNLGHTTANGGFHLLGNPYAAPLYWDNVVYDGNGRLQNPGLADALYLFKSSGQYAGSYTTYVPSAPPLRTAATGTPIIPVGQAFFVYNPTQGTTASLNLQAASTAFDNVTPVQRTAAETRPYLALTLQDAAQAHAHQTLVYFDAAATAGFDARHDARYLPGAGQALSLTTAAAGQEYAVNGLPTLGRADVAVPLHLRATAAGTYTLKAEELANLPAGTHAYLLDATTGTRQDLATTPSATITLAANASEGARYSLLFTGASPLATAPAALAQLAGLYPNPAHGTTALALPATLRGGQPVPVAIVNSLGQVVRRATATTDELALPLDGLAAGLYTVQARTAAGTISRRLTVE